MQKFRYEEIIAEAKKTFAKVNEFATTVTVILGKTRIQVARSGETFAIIG